MTILKTNKLAGPGGTNAIDGSVYFQGYVDGTNSDYLKTADLDDYDMGTGDFTFECWARGVEHTGSGDRAMGIFSSGAFTAGGLLIQNKNNGPLRVVIPLAAGGNFDESGSTNLWYGNWHHIAVVKTSNTIKAFINGVQEISATHSVGVDFAHGGYATVGENCYVTYPGDYPYRGYISNLRLIKGSALYTSNFTPPTEKLKAIDDTVLLCCQDSDDPTQEATGKTITGYGGLAAGQPIAPRVLPPVGVDAGTVFEGDITFDSLNYMTLPKGTTTQANRGRGLLGGSNDGSPFSDNIQYINIQSQGNSVDFGNLSEARSRASSYASSTRGIWGGGSSAPTSKTDRIDYVTIATTANAIDFGNLTLSRRFCSGTSSATRGLTAGGNEASPSSPYPSVNVIDYTTIASAGDATDFGDLLAGARSGPGALSSPTRALFAGGYSHGSPAGATNDINYVEIATTGNAVDFGDLSVTKRYLAGVSNNTRGVFGSGSNPAAKNIIDYVTIATTGDATDFGDNTIANEHRAGISNSIRGVWAGSGSPAIGNTIDFVIIATTGNATDFGDTATNMGYTAGCSDSHGGLSQ